MAWTARRIACDDERWFSSLDILRGDSGIDYKNCRVDRGEQP